MSHKVLGKIQSIRIGHGGYDDVMFGVSFSLGDDSSGCQDFWGFWMTAANDNWGEDTRQKRFGEAFYKLWKLMQDAKVSNAMDLEGTPIEMTYESVGGRLQSWRILTEVI